MANRLNLLPVWLGHWRGLTMRRYRYDLPEDDDRSLSVGPDVLARSLTLAIPVLAGVVAAVVLWGKAPTWHIAGDVAGVVVAAAALMSGGLLGAFSLLAAWRERLDQNGRRRQRPLRAMIDEAVAHILLATLESALLVAAAFGALVARGFLAEAFACFAVALGAHVLYLFVLLVPRLYSVYAQTVDVDELMDGHTRV